MDVFQLIIQSKKNSVFHACGLFRRHNSSHSRDDSSVIYAHVDITSSVFSKATALTLSRIRFSLVQPIESESCITHASFADKLKYTCKMLLRSQYKSSLKFMSTSSVVRRLSYIILVSAIRDNYICSWARQYGFEIYLNHDHEVCITVAVSEFNIIMLNVPAQFLREF